MPIVCGPPEVTSVNGRTRWSAPVTGSQADSLWFSIPAEFEEMLNDRADTALLALLLPAMRTGQGLHIRGTVTAELLRWTTELVQELVTLKLPGYRKIAITAEATGSAWNRKDGIAMGFSAGVDSFAALHEWFLDSSLPEDQRLTHLLFNNVGSHGESESSASHLFRHRLARLEPIARGIGLPLIDVDSNLHAHFQLPDRYAHAAFANTHTVRNAAVAHLLSQGIGTWVLASSTPLSRTNVDRTGVIDGADAILLPALSTGSLELRIANATQPRVEKTRLISELPLAQQHLDVCISSEHTERNCSICWKCMRTQTTLDILGQVQNFNKVFDLDAYRSNYEDYVIDVLTSNSKLELEVRELAVARGWVWPAPARRKALIKKLAEVGRPWGRKLKKRLGKHLS